jgi:hypothetical protein
MPNYTEIFFGSNDDQDTIVDKVSSALGIPLKPSDEPYAAYLGMTEDLVLDFNIRHSLEDDAGIPFEDMPYTLTVRSLRGRQLEEPAARRIFHELEGLNYRPMYLVRGLQEILERID